MRSEVEPIPVTSPAAAQVFQEILLHGPLARVEIAARTGLSAGAVTRVATPLLEEGYLIESGAAPFKPGRPSRPLAVNPGARRALGVKITPDRVYGVATDLAVDVLAVASAKVAETGIDAVEQAVRAVVGRLRGRLTGAVAGLGIGVSGDVDRESGVVRSSALMGWSGAALGERLADLGPVMVDNDVHAFTCGEWLFGAGRGAESLALVTVGSGIGSGLVVDGRLARGAYGVAGEISHLPVAAGNSLCQCGRRGCLESVAASGAIAAAVARAVGQPGLSFPAAVRLAREGQRRALDVLVTAGQTLGRALACVANLTGPAVILVAGEGVDAFELYREVAERAYRDHTFGDAARAPIRSIPHSFNDWARGAAAEVVLAIARSV